MNTSVYLLILVPVILYLTIRLLLNIYKPKIRGAMGEKKVAFILRFLSQKNYKTINNVLLKTSFGTTQIDHIVVSKRGIFVIETKNYIGSITGSEHSEMWKQSVAGKKREFQNPIQQNRGHISALKKTLLGLGPLYFFSIIAFSNEARLTIRAESAYVIRWKRLFWTIWKHRKRRLSDDQVKQIVACLQAANINTYTNRRIHVKTTKENVVRKKAALAAGLCPYCGGKLVKRKGKFGKFYGCSNFPSCRFMKRYESKRGFFARLFLGS